MASQEVNVEAIFQGAASLRDVYPALADRHFVAAYSTVRDLAHEGRMSMANVVALLNAGAFVSRSFLSGEEVLRIRPDLAAQEQPEVRSVVGGFASAHVAQNLLVQTNTQAFASRAMLLALERTLGAGHEGQILPGVGELEPMDTVESELLGGCLRALARVAEDSRLSLESALNYLSSGQASYASPAAALERIIDDQVPGLAPGDRESLIGRTISFMTLHKDSVTDALVGEMIDEWADRYLPDAIVRARQFVEDEHLHDFEEDGQELHQHQVVEPEPDIDDWLSGGFNLDR